MIMNKNFIRLTAITRKLDIPSELEEWLLSEYGWEPCDDLWSPEELIDIIEFNCIRYHSGKLDATIPDDASLWKDRAESAKYILQGIILEKDHLLNECGHYIRLLEKHGIEY